ncbi:hypothetical protein GRI44_00980 [Altererythrobacter confluentis]|uniref:O-antigen ligase n=1 Tax=Allopontixanthobacter confluentis TaxID=1849021 RepID=A0A6L7GBJ5_9SPHN|nr:hypothetical protein [Allopontixanthobacter confluentis]MXP13333.1 hypothetical protein [Allopontixanthobacter confluentis]
MRTRSHHTANAFDNLERGLLTFAIATFPLYIFPSGGLQPSHFFFLLVAGISIYRHGPLRQIWVELMAILAVYILIVELASGAYPNELQHLANPAFFLFNFLLMTGSYRVISRYGASTLNTGVAVAISIALGGAILGGFSLQGGGQIDRGVGFFNNPNQLGYFSVCITSLSTLIYINNSVSFFRLMILLSLSLFLSVISLSKAAMLANFLTIFFAARPLGRWGTKQTIWAASPALLLGLGLWISQSGAFDHYHFVERLANMGSENDSSAAERGYFAFLQGGIISQIFGLGSVETYKIVGHEVHSTLAVIWNTYGLVGFLIFVPILVIWGRTSYKSFGPIATLALVGPPLLYGLTHNGTRFSILWFLVSATMALAHREARRRKSKMPALAVDVENAPNRRRIYRRKRSPI